jgi:hypothetical protein
MCNIALKIQNIIKIQTTILVFCTLTVLLHICVITSHYFISVCGVHRLPPPPPDYDRTVKFLRGLSQTSSYRKSLSSEYRSCWLLEKSRVQMSNPETGYMDWGLLCFSSAPPLNIETVHHIRPRLLSSTFSLVHFSLPLSHSTCAVQPAQAKASYRSRVCNYFTCQIFWSCFILFLKFAKSA